MRKIIVIVMAAFMLVGCNTLHGMGQDIEKAGEAVQKSTQ
jgi:predicted small secreted protein